MYNQNENVPFNWANVQRNQSYDSYPPQEEAPPYESEYPGRYISSEHATYDFYDEYEPRPESLIQPNLHDLAQRPPNNYPTSSAQIPNWDPHSAHSATLHGAAAVQPMQHSQRHSPYQPYESHIHQIPPAQFGAWGYWNNSYYSNSEHSHQTRRHSTPGFDPNADSGEVTAAGKAKPPSIIKACASCKASHVACDPGRPCQRCIRLGKTDTCVDAKRKKRGRPKNSSKSQKQQPVRSTTDSAGSSSAEATPITTAATRDPPEELLELSKLLGEYETSSGEQTPTDYYSAPINPRERHPSPISTERRATPLSPLALIQSSALEGQSSIRKQKSLPSSLAARRGSSTSPNSTPRRRHSHRSAQEAPVTNIQPIMLQHHQSVQYPGAQHRHAIQATRFQHPPAMALIADMQGTTQLRTSFPQSQPPTSSTPSRAIHPLSTQFTYADSNTETEYRNMHHNR